MSNTAYKEYINKLEHLHEIEVKSNPNGYYVGDRNSEGQPNGLGVMSFPDGKTYKGEWKSTFFSVELNGYAFVEYDSILVMEKNLSVKTFRNGDSIPQVTSVKDWERFGKQRKPAWCYYDNDEIYGNEFGILYNWHAVTDPRGLAPEGWKLPSTEDWEKLIMSYREHLHDIRKEMENDGDFYDGDLEEFLIFHNCYGGARWPDGNFDGDDKNVFWWSTIENKSNINSIMRYQDDNDINGFKVEYLDTHEGMGMYVRCIGDYQSK